MDSSRTSQPCTEWSGTQLSSKLLLSPQGFETGAFELENTKWCGLQVVRGVFQRFDGECRKTVTFSVGSGASGCIHLSSGNGPSWSLPFSRALLNLSRCCWEQGGSVQGQLWLGVLLPFDDLVSLSTQQPGNSWDEPGLCLQPSFALEAELQ